MTAPKPALSTPPGQALLALADGSIFHGVSIGANGSAVGEVVFNTAMTGYQEILTDPSYRQQIVTLTYPHIGNVGTNPEDAESSQVHIAGLVLREVPRPSSNFRSTQGFSDYLRSNNVVAIAGLDTRRLTRLLRDKGAQNGCIVAGARISEKKALEAAREFPGLKGADLARVVTRARAESWTTGSWRLETNRESSLADQRFHVVAYDFGVKRNILRMLVDRGCRVTVVPAQTPADEVFKLKPDGVFLSNGPGDPEPCTRFHAGQTAALWNLSGPPDSRARCRCPDPEDEVRSPRRQSPGPGSGQRASPDHLAEPRLRR
jgi:carbamoyl-phosphate synthase small subunit